MAGRSGLTLKPCWRTQAVTAGPPPLTTGMVRASTWVRRSTRAGLATVDAACAAPVQASWAGHWGASEVGAESGVASRTIRAERLGRDEAAPTPTHTRQRTVPQQPERSGYPL